MPKDAYLNDISVVAPGHDIHRKFIDFAPALLKDDRSRALFRRMAERCQIEHRYSVLKGSADPELLDADGFYRPGAFPDTETRMGYYRSHALPLARRALDGLGLQEQKDEITHLILTTCTGFYAPGLDIEVVETYGLNPSVERTIVGFMGCYAGMNALKLGRHIVRSDAGARVLILNLELCTLHLQETTDLEQMLSFMIFSDGCAASIVSAEPRGIELQRFHSAVMPASADQITWAIGGSGFDMNLSGKVPGTIAAGLPCCLPDMLAGDRVERFRHWAVHPGGRTILDAVKQGADIPEDLLQSSRRVLRDFGNMSSATIMFVLKDIMEQGSGRGCGMAFGPGLTVESVLFEQAA
jgi:alpha-pyrone synthase